MKNSARSNTFLPEVFKTPENRQFLQSTLEPLSSKELVTPISGYIGRKFGPGAQSSDGYVPTIGDRNQYMLEPTVVKTDSNTVKSALTYTNVVNAIKLMGSSVTDHSRLFSNEFYAWDAFCNLDMLVNYNQYYWLPTGPEVVNIVSESYLNVDSTIVGKPSATVGDVVFLNGQKVLFSGNIHPSSYIGVEYYVEGVGSSIRLVPVAELSVPKLFGTESFTAYDEAGFGEVYDPSVAYATTKDYITINRASEDRNAWSRTNRWFHQSVLEQSASINATTTAQKILDDQSARAKRPIIEFYTDLKLFNHGEVARDVDFYVSPTSRNLVNVKSATVTSTSGSTVYITTNSISDFTVGNTFVFYQGVAGSILANVAYTVATVGANFVTLMRDGEVVNFGTNSSLAINAITGQVILGSTLDVETHIIGANRVFLDVGSIHPAQPDNELYDGALVVFSSDSTTRVTIARKSVTTYGEDRVITLATLSEFPITSGSQINVQLGQNSGKSFYYTDSWQTSQQKTTTNQPPLFDVFSTAGASFGNSDFYPDTTFSGSKLFGYKVGTSSDDIELGFPLAYSSVTNLGDISFQAFYNSDTFVADGETIAVNSGVAHAGDTVLNGWVKTVGPSVQYQVFEQTFIGSPIVCDIVPIESAWPTVIVNDVNGDAIEFTMVVTDVTTITPSASIGDKIQIKIYSAQVSKTAYYEVPSNLNNNPFNGDVVNINAGDLREQHKSICNNHPNFSGNILGVNNFSQLANPAKYANKLIQSSFPVAYLGAMLGDTNLNIVDALEYSASEYFRYKSTLNNLVGSRELSYYTQPREILDEILGEIAENREFQGPFYYSDMVPKDIGSTVSYTFATNFVNASIALSKTYSNVASYSAVNLYRRATVDDFVHDVILVRGVDYELSNTSPEAIVYNISAGDVVLVVEYDVTYGAYVPNTPSKLGIFTSQPPHVEYDETYVNPAWVIRGHDYSVTKMYGEYADGVFSDFRDAVLFEFEVRIFNNIKTTAGVNPVSYIPGKSRDFQEFSTMYAELFNAWLGKHKLDHTSQYYTLLDQRTWNYRGCYDVLGDQVTIGNTKGLYLHHYDTDTPNLPWTILGYSNKPSWWDTKYGVSPYTSDNALLWGDIAAGIDYNNGSPKVIPERVRNNFVIPVDTNGELVPVIGNLIPTYEPLFNFNRDWVAGDLGPVEYSYRKSSQFMFDLAKIYFLTNPVKFVCENLDSDRYNSANSYQVDGVSRKLSALTSPYGTSDSPQHGFAPLVIDSMLQHGIDATDYFNAALTNLDVRLSYPLAGFSDQNMLKFFVEKTSPNGKSKSLLIPDENYAIVNHVAQIGLPEYSSVIVQKTDTGYAVWGNSQKTPKFNFYTPIKHAKTVAKTVGNLTVNLPTKFDQVKSIAYGTVFSTVQTLSEFMVGYGAYLESNGLVFDYLDSGDLVDWSSMVGELLYWVQSGWDSGSSINLNPCAKKIHINLESGVIQPLGGKHSVLSQNLTVIPTSDMQISRDGTELELAPNKLSDSLSYAQFESASIEHLVIFDNKTTFDDLIYNLETGLRQFRLIVKGTKTAEWHGFVNHAGFIMNQGDVPEWNENTRYQLGAIVKHNGVYYTAKELTGPSAFSKSSWIVTEYGEIKRGLLTNLSHRASLSLDRYDSSKFDFETDDGNLAASLVGYRARNYLLDADLSEIAQFHAYSNMVESKGTNTALDAFNTAKLVRGEINYSTSEIWAIKARDFGFTGDNYVEYPLSPIVQGTALTFGQYPLRREDILGYKVSPPDSLIVDSPASSVFDFGGNVEVDHSYYGFGEFFASSDVMLVGEYVTFANTPIGWNVCETVVAPTVVSVSPALNSTSTLSFSTSHHLSVGDLIVVSGLITGKFQILSTPTHLTATVAYDMGSSTKTIKGAGTVLRLTSRKYESATVVPNGTTRFWINNVEYSTIKSEVGQTVSSTVGKLFGNTEYATFGLTSNSVVRYIDGAINGTHSAIASNAELSVGGTLALSSDNTVTFKRITNKSTQLVVCDLGEYTDSNVDAVVGEVISLSADGEWAIVSKNMDDDCSIIGLQLIENLSDSTKDTPSIVSGATQFALTGNTTSVIPAHIVIQIAGIQYIILSAIFANNVTTYTVDKQMPQIAAGTGIMLVDWTITKRFDFAVASGLVISGIQTDSSAETIIVSYANADGGQGLVQVYSRVVQQITTQIGSLKYSTFADYSTTDPVVKMNGVLLVDGDDYSFSDSSITLVDDPGLAILSINTGILVLQQNMTIDVWGVASQDANYGKSIATTIHAELLAIGAPGQATSNTNTGTVTVAKHGGKSDGEIFVSHPGISTNVLINGVLVSIADTDTNSQIAQKINHADIANVIATVALSGVAIKIKNKRVGTIGDYLTITLESTSVANTLDYTPYTVQQQLIATRDDLYSNYGMVVKFDETKTLYIAAPKQLTSLNIDIGVILDQGATTSVDSNPDGGAIDVCQSIDGIYLKCAILQNPGDYQGFSNTFAINSNEMTIGSQSNVHFQLVEKFTEIDINVYGADLSHLNSVKIHGDDATDLEVIDFSKGKIFSVITDNADYLRSVDPADYQMWHSDHDGEVWADVSNLRYTGQDSWAPGSTTVASTWVTSTTKPDKQFSQSVVVDSTGRLVTRYHYWQDNSGVLGANKTLSDTIIAMYLLSPQNSGIPYVTVNSNNVVFSGVECNGNNTLCFSTGGTSPITSEFSLITNSGEFIEGFDTKSGLYLKLLDSISGIDSNSLVVPDPSLPTSVKYGVANVPRQSMSMDANAAFKTVIDYVNTVLSTVVAQCPNDIASYVKQVDWWDAAYGKQKAVKHVPNIHGLETVPSPYVGMVVSVSGQTIEYYRYDAATWTLVGVIGGTYQFSSSVLSATATVVRNIVGAVFETVFTDDLQHHRAKLLEMLLVGIVNEHKLANLDLSWLMKTSFIDVEYNAGELVASKKYLLDNASFLEDYIQEAKPYHVVIRDFVQSNTLMDSTYGAVSDFDLPATYRGGDYVSPMLKSVVKNSNEFVASDTIWSESPYSGWKNNCGISLADNSTIVVTKITEYVGIGATQIRVGSVVGLPSTGVITVDDEDIFYASSNPTFNTLTGLQRGVNGTTITDHQLVGVYLKTSAIVVIHGGRGYSVAPTIAISGECRTNALATAKVSNGSVTEIVVTNRGDGYTQPPVINISPAFSGTVTNTYSNHAARIVTTVAFSTGDIVTYRGSLTGLNDGEQYYIKVHSSTTTSAGIAQFVSFYRRRADIGYLTSSLPLSGQGGTIEVGAYAIVLVENGPTRAFDNTIKLDRTSFRAQIPAYSHDYHVGSTDVAKYFASSAATLRDYEVYKVTGAASGSGQDAEFIVHKANFVSSNHYTVTIKNGGSGYVIGEHIVIDGGDLGGIAPTNNATLTVTGINGGSIVSASIVGVGFTELKSGAAFPELTVTAVTNGATHIDLAVSSNLSVNHFNHREIYVRSDSGEYSVSPSTVDGAGAEFDISLVSYVDNTPVPVYSAKVASSGVGYSLGQVITIGGGTLGGTSANKCTITVTSVGSSGEILAITVVGNSVANIHKLYARAVDSDTLRVSSTKNYQHVGDLSIEVGDIIGLSNPGALAPSVVHINHEFYTCVVSNSDEEFDPLKWEKLDQDDASINAMDRLSAMYVPEANSLGRKLNQWFTGTQYPYGQFVGNTFSASLPNDVVLNDKKFKLIADVNDICVANGVLYGVADTSSNSFIITSEDGVDWAATKLSNAPLGTTSITHSNGTFIVTTMTPTVGVMISADGENWTAPNAGTGYDSFPYDAESFDGGGANVPTGARYDSTYHGQFYACGQSVIASPDSLNWSSLHDLGVSNVSGVVNSFHAIKHIETTGFNGFMAVGVIGNTTKKSIVATSVNGTVFTTLELPFSETLRDVSAIGDLIIAVGDNGLILASEGGTSWTQASSSTSANLLAIDNTIVVGENGTILTSIDGINWAARSSGTANDLRTTLYNAGTYVAGGVDGAILLSANKVDWTPNDSITSADELYDVVGSEFEYGYSPEELVSGMVRDKISIQTDATPSGYYGGEYQKYGSNGFSMTPLELIPNTDNVAYFGGTGLVIMSLAVFHTGIRIFDYIVNWADKSITFESEYDVVTVELYCAGGGNRVEVSSSEFTPARFDGIHTKFMLEITPSMILDGAHPAYVDGVKTTALINIENEVAYLVLPGDMSTKYVAYAIMGSIEPEIETFTLTGVSPFALTVSEPLANYITQNNAVVFGHKRNVIGSVYPTFAVSDANITITNSYLSSGDTLTVTMKTLDLIKIDEFVYSGNNNFALSSQNSIMLDASGITVQINGINILEYTLLNGVVTVDGTLHTGDVVTIIPNTYSIPTTAVFDAVGRDTFAIRQGAVLVEIDGVQTSNFTVNDYTLTLGSPVTGKVSVTTFGNNRGQQLKTTNFTGKKIAEIDTVADNIVTTKTPHGRSNGDHVIVAGRYGYSAIGGTLVSISSTQFSIVDPSGEQIEIQHRGGGVVTLDGDFTIDHAGMALADTSRLFVYINGVRTSTVEIYQNQVIYLGELGANDVVNVTSMIAHASPNRMTLTSTVDNTGLALYAQNRTWLADDIDTNATQFRVGDIGRLLDVQTHNIVVDNGAIKLPGKGNNIVGVSVVDENAQQVEFTLDFIEFSPWLHFDDSLNGAVMTITVARGGDIVIGFETMIVTDVNMLTNQITVIRGRHMSSPQDHDKYEWVIDRGMSRLPNYFTKRYGTWDTPLSASGTELANRLVK